MTRTFVAGVAGAVAMYVVSAGLHMSPLGMIGLTVMDTPIAAPLAQALGDKGKLFYYPPPTLSEADYAKAPQMMLAYIPPGQAMMSPKQLGGEFLSELVQALLAAFVAAAVAGGFWRRWGAVAAVGAAVSLGTNFSYMIWFGFSGGFTAAMMLIQVLAYAAAGAAIAGVLGWKRKGG